MTARPKFLFDIDFRQPPPARPAPAEPPPPETVQLDVHAEAVRAAREAGFAEGLAEGRRLAGAEDESRLVATLEALRFELARACGELAGLAAKAEASAATLALAFAGTLARAFADREPLAPVADLARSIFRELRGTPHVVVRINDAQVEAVKPRLDAIARETGYAGAIVVLGEPEIAGGDVRIEWADGGVVRDGAALQAQIDEAVRRYFDTTRREDQRA